MPGTAYLKVARVLKARGLEGKVTAAIADGLPFCLDEGLAVSVVPPTLYGVRHTSITELNVLGDGTIIVALDGVRSIDDAEELVGRWLLARRDDLGLEPGEYVDELLDRTVVDEELGELGVVTEVLETKASEILVVEGVHGEVLIPFVEEMVLDVPEDLDEPILTRIPEGLVNL